MWKIFFAATWLFVESMGVPLLSEGAFGPLSAAVHHGDISLHGAYIAAYLATIAGNTAGYLAFWFYGPALRRWMSRRWPNAMEKMEQLEPKIRTQVFIAMGIARFVGLGTFGFVLWIAGLIRTPWKWFLPYLFLLNLIWCAAWLYASHALVGVLLEWIKAMEVTTVALLGVAAVVGYFAVHHGIKVGVKYWKKRMARSG